MQDFRDGPHDGDFGRAGDRGPACAAPFVSRIAVVIPVLDRSEPLLEALVSVAAQRRVPFRVVVVDDGSRDPVDRPVSRWREQSRPGFELCILRQENHGAAHARNRGFEHCGGADLIAFLDSDDRWPADFLERTGAALESNSEAVAATTDRDYGWKSSELPPRHHHSSEIATNAAEFLLRHGGGVGSATLLRSSAFAKAGRYDESLPTGHDAALFLRLSTLGPWLHAPGAAVLYADDPAATNHLRYRFADFRRHWARIDEEFLSEFGRPIGVSESFARRHLARRWRLAGEQLLADSKAAEARKCFERSLGYRVKWKAMRGLAESLLHGRR